jgi:hypothetical protein
VVVDLATGINWHGATPSSVYVNPCLQMQEAINPALVMSGPSEDTDRSITIRGSATVEYGDLYDYGPFRVCLAMFPTTTSGTSGAWTDADSDGLIDGTSYPIPRNQDYLNTSYMSINWNKAKVTLDMTGQAEPSVFMMRGSGYLVGRYSSANEFKGSIGDNWTEAGSLRLRKTNAEVTSAWTRGRIVGASVTTLMEAAKSFVYVWDQGIRRSSLEYMRLEVIGNASDYDDVGIVSAQSWGTNYSHTRIRSVANAVRLYDNNIREWSQFYFNATDYGVVLGDFTIGGESPLYSSCVCASGVCGTGSTCSLTTNSQAYGATFSQGVNEDCDYGCIVVIDGGQDVLFKHVWIETTKAAIRGHQVLLGAGQCGAGDSYSTCGKDADCPSSGTCAFTSTWSPGTSIVFSNTLIPTDGGWLGAASCVGSADPQPCCTGPTAGVTCVDWDGMFVGPSTRNNGYYAARFPGSIINTTYKAAAPTTQLFFGTNADGAQRMVMDFSGALGTSQTQVFPDYKAVKGDHDFAITWEMDETGLNGDSGKCMANAGGALVTCGAATDVALPYQPIFWTGGSCVLYDVTGWAIADKAVFELVEVGATGTLTALAGGVQIPTNLAAVPVAYNLYTKKDGNEPKQALGVQGSTGAVAVRLRLKSGNVDAGDNAVGTIKCTVRGIPMPTVSNQDAFGLQ